MDLLYVARSTTEIPFHSAEPEDNTVTFHNVFRFVFLHWQLTHII